MNPMEELLYIQKVQIAINILEMGILTVDEISDVTELPFEKVRELSEKYRHTSS